jgi:hypothetical protein
MGTLQTMLSSASNATHHVSLAQNSLSVRLAIDRVATRSFLKTTVLRNAQLELMVTVMAYVLNAYHHV